MIHTVIKTVPSRERYLKDVLLPSLPPECGAPTLFTDAEYRGVTWNARRAWEWGAEKKEGVILMLQDDCIFHPQFGPSILNVQTTMMNNGWKSVSPYTHYPVKPTVESYAAGCSYLACFWYIYGEPAMLLTPSSCADMLACSEHQGDRSPDDWTVTESVRRTGDAMYQCLPSLVKHNTALQTTVGTKHRGSPPLWHPVIDPERFLSSKSGAFHGYGNTLNRFSPLP